MSDCQLDGNNLLLVLLQSQNTTLPTLPLQFILSNLVPTVIISG